LPTEDPDKLYDYDNLFDFLKIFDIAGRSLVDREDFTRVAYETMEDGVQLGNLKYREMFFNPTSHLMEGIAYSTVVDGIIAGLKQAERDFGVKCNLIAAIHRGHTPAAAREMVEQVVAERRDEVIGIGADAVTPDGREGLELFTDAYAYAKRHGLRVSTHCAELPGTVANFDYALDVLQCDRIDHGYRVLDDSKALNRARDEGVCFTCAPTSTSRCYDWPDLSQHPIRRMVEEGLRVTLNSDDPTMFGTDIGREFVVACTAMQFSPEKATELALNGVDGSWLEAGERRRLRQAFEREIADLKTQLDP
jgi:adenosine deaminase